MLEVLIALTEAQLLHAAALEKMASMDTQTINFNHKITGDAVRPITIRNM